MPPPVPVKLFLKDHRDCFLHATTSWLNYNFSPDKEAKLAIVRVILPNGHSFLATLCPEAIPYHDVQRGVSHKKYLEIDNSFARELGLSKQGLEVFIETGMGVEVCIQLTIAPKFRDDLVKLERNFHKIDDLAEKIRIVSGQQSFSFPIWIDNIVVPVRVEKTEPSATWVLIMPNTTKLEIIAGPERVPLDRLSYYTNYASEDYDYLSQPQSFGSSNPPKSRLSSINSSDSSVDSEVGGGSIGSQQLNQSLPTKAWMTLTSMIPFMSRNSPSPYEDGGGGGGGRASGASSSEGFPFHPTVRSPKKEVLDELLRTVPPSMSISGMDVRREAIPPLKSNSSGVRPSSISGKSSHERSQTWGSSSDFLVPMSGGGERRRTSNALRGVNTPGLSARLRVQPYLSANDSDCQNVWASERYFDVFVNPASLPEVFLSLEDKSAAILVDLVPIESPSKPPQGRGSADDSGRGGVDSELNEINRMSSTLEKQSVGGSEREQKGLPASLVVRMFFATKIRSSVVRRGGYGTRTERYQMEALFGEGVVSEGDSVVEVPIEEGHILISNLVRHQLGVAMCSGVMVNQVKDEWRIAYKQVPSLQLLPLDPSSQKVGDERFKREIKEQFTDLVGKMFAVDAIGAPLVSKQIVELQLNQDVWMCCSVRVTPYKRTTLTTPFLLVSHADLNDRIKVTVNLSRGLSELATRRPFPRRNSPTMPIEIKLPDMSELNQPSIFESEKMVGGFEKLLSEGELFLKTVFSKPGNSGCLLITGTTGPEGTGCGKTTLARLLCKRAMKKPYYAHVSMTECTTFRGQSSARVKRRLRYLFSQAIQHHPSVLLLDDIEHAMPQVSDAQELITEEGTASIKKALVFLNLLQEVRSVNAQVVVIATVWYRNHLNQYLLQSRGFHVFDKTLELHPPTLVERKDILNALFRRMYTHEEDAVHSSLIREVAMRTEGYQPGDLETLVERAISHAELRTLNPMNSLSLISDIPPDSPRKKTRSRHSSFSSPDKEPGGVDIPSRPGSNTSLLGRSYSPPLSVTPPSLRRLIDQGGGGVSFSREDSMQTVVSVSPAFRKIRSLSDMRLSLKDFSAALEGFVPVSLRGLPLHSAGAVDFSHIGGLDNVKEILTETLSWPSKYPRLFSQCPIRQQCGILLYGAPGTGKTMLAGAVAKEFGLNFISIKGPELLNKYIGASEEAVRNLFSRAQSAKPCILFFDEFESLAPKRGHDDTGVTDRVVNQFLTQLDGVEVLSGVYVLAASSRPDLIDPALLRPGRIDNKIECLIPNEAARLDILRVLSKVQASMSDSGLREIATATEGFTGADLKALLYSAQLQAAHEALEKKTREEEKQRRVSEHSLSEVSPGAAVFMAETDGEEEERPASLSSTSSLLTFHSSVSGVRGGEVDLQQSLLPKVSKLKQKLTEKRRRHSSVTLKSFPLNKYSSPETKRHTQSRVIITMDHWRDALKEVRPSVTEQEKAKYRKIYDVFTGKTRPEPFKPKVTMS